MDLSNNIEENKEICKLDFNGKLVSIGMLEVRGEEDRLILSGEDGFKLELSSHHDQDCCERVYADWGSIKQYADTLMGKEFDSITVKSVKEAGILLCFQYSKELGEVFEEKKVFIPCYDDQDGYYSSDLELVINGKVRFDISDFVKEVLI